jgi:predicted DNA binding CopG/RHH family protein
MKKKLKKFPIFKTDKEAEDFIDNADLTDYDISGFKPMHFEFAPKSRAISVRLPESLYSTVQKKAAAEGIQAQRFIRRALEQAVS